MRDLQISISEEETQSCSKGQWKNITKRQVKTAAFTFLQSENIENNKTKYIKLNSLRISKYLLDNVSTSLSKVILSVRPGTFNIMYRNIWKHTDNNCVGCKIAAETISHFMTCESYLKESQVKNWKLLPEKDFKKRKVQERSKMREMKNIEDGLASDTLAP